MNNRVKYLRISVTDRCNLKCTYCMPKEGVKTVPYSEILSFEEIIRLTKIFVKLGITKVRLTGGDPLMRRNLPDLVKMLKKVDGIEEICMTTNGILLPLFAHQLKEAGLDRINISLDTLKKERFEAISRGPGFDNVMNGIQIANKLFKGTRINVVAMKGVNDDEFADLVDFALKEKLIMTFIEYMEVSPIWNPKEFIPIKEVMELCSQRHDFIKTGKNGLGPADYFQVGETRIGFISTTLENCALCSRLRLTATGDLKVCLYQKEGVPLKTLLRSGSDEQIEQALIPIFNSKKDITYKSFSMHEVYMSSVGG